LTGECDAASSWSEWYSRDRPTYTGDYETVSDLRRENASLKSCNIKALEGRVKGTKKQWTTQKVSFGLNLGLKCLNNDNSVTQKAKWGNDARCDDYEVRFCCQDSKTTLLTGECDAASSWSEWYSRDRPTYTGDYETVSDLRRENASLKSCNIKALEGRVKGTKKQWTTQKVSFGLNLGLKCLNNDNSVTQKAKWGNDAPCDDYEVRFCCQENVHVCEHSSHAKSDLQEGNLRCPTGEVLIIQSAIYGRIDGGTDCQYNGACQSSYDLTSYAQEECDGKKSCVFKGTNGHLGDPCVGIHKYTKITFYCHKESPVVTHKSEL